MGRLKFDLNPMVKCYNYHAFACGILQGYSFFDSMSIVQLMVDLKQKFQIEMQDMERYISPHHV